MRADMEYLFLVFWGGMSYEYVYRCVSGPRLMPK